MVGKRIPQVSVEKQLTLWGGMVELQSDREYREEMKRKTEVDKPPKRKRFSRLPVTVSEAY